MLKAVAFACLVGFTASSLATRSVAASPCEALVEKAGAVPAGAWAKGSKALSPWLQIDEPRGELQGLPARIANDPRVAKAIAFEPGLGDVEVSRLAGTDIYAASTLQGTLRCQTIAFVSARPGRPVRLVASPPGLEDGDDLCWTRSGDVGRVFGKPAFIEHGGNSQSTDAEDVRITPWLNGRWGHACTLKLRFRPTFALVERRCRDASVCTAVDSIALKIAVAYDRKESAAIPDGEPFRWPTAEAPDEIRQAVEATREPLTDWPGFNPVPNSRPMSYGGLFYFPLVTPSGAYVVAITHEGVGWRGGPTTLLLVHTVRNGELVPQAGYAVERKVAGLASATAK